MSEKTSQQPAPAGNMGLLLISWLWVAIPLAYGVYELMTKTAKLFVQ